MSKITLRHACRADAVQGKQRFEEEFGPPDDSDDEGGARAVRRPAEYKALLRHSNTSDHFRIGVRVTRASVRLHGLPIPVKVGTEQGLHVHNVSAAVCVWLTARCRARLLRCVAESLHVLAQHNGATVLTDAALAGEALH